MLGIPERILFCTDRTLIPAMHLMLLPHFSALWLRLYHFRAATVKEQQLS